MKHIAYYADKDSPHKVEIRFQDVTRMYTPKQLRAMQTAINFMIESIDHNSDESCLVAVTQWSADEVDKPKMPKTTEHVYVTIDHDEVSVLREIRSGLRYSCPRFPGLAVGRLVACEFIDFGFEADGEKFIVITAKGREYLASYEAESD